MDMNGEGRTRAPMMLKRQTRICIYLARDMNVCVAALQFGGLFSAHAAEGPVCRDILLATVHIHQD